MMPRRDLAHRIAVAQLDGEAVGLEGALTEDLGQLLLNRAHGTRLLARAWDWSNTPTQDGGFATVGEFGTDGLKVVGYSRAVRFGTLGICPQL